MQQNLTKYANWLSWYFLAIIALMPFHAFLTTWAGSNFGHLDLFRIWKEIGVVIAAPAVLYLGFRDHDTKRWLLGSPIPRLFVAYTIVHGLVGLWALTADRVTAAALIYALLINLRFIGFFILLVVLARLSPVLRTYWWRALLAPAVAVVVFGLLQVVVLPHDFLRHFGYGPDTIPAFQTVDNKLDYQRIQSTLRGANPLGAYLVALIVLAVARYRQDKMRIIPYLAFIGLACTVLFFTYSRSAYIGTVLGVGVVMIVSLRAKVSRRYMLIGAASLLLILGAGVYMLREQNFVQNTLFHSDETSTSSESSNQKRTSALQSGLRDVMHEPLGRGPGTAGPASARNDHAGRIAENYYLQLGQEVGWLGLALFVAVQIIIAKVLWRARKEWASLALGASLVGLTFVNLVSHAWTDDTLAYVWWGACAVVYAGLVRNVAKNRGATSRN